MVEGFVFVMQGEGGEAELKNIFARVLNLASDLRRFAWGSIPCGRFSARKSIKVLQHHH